MWGSQASGSGTERMRSLLILVKTPGILASGTWERWLASSLLGCSSHAAAYRL